MQRVHLDTDLGGDIDDLCALAMLLKWPGVEVAAVTTVADEGGRRAGYTRYALSLAGRADIPVAAGADVALGCYRTAMGYYDEARYWPEPVTRAPGPQEVALALLRRSIEQGATVIAIGPYTNLALLEQRWPGILHDADLHLMGGYVHAPRAGFPPWGSDMDWNMQVDAAAAQAVLAHSRPTLTPLAMTVETALRRSALPALAAGDALAQLVARQAEAFAEDEQMERNFGAIYAGVPDDIINFQHDPLACAVAVGWQEGVEVQELPVRTELVEGWLRQNIDPAGSLMRVVTQVDGPRFSERWLQVVAG